MSLGCGRVCSGKAWLGVGLIAFFCSLAIAQLPPPGQRPPTRIQPGEVAPKSESKPQQATPAPTAPAQPEEQDTVLGRSTTQQVLVPTTVTDKGNYVNGLSISDFQLFDNGKLQRIASDFSYQPLSLVLAVQANSEVEAMLPKIKKMGVLLHGLVTGDAGDVAVLAFDHRMRLMQDFTSDADRLDDAMQKISAGSSTSRTIDAVVEADRMLKQHDRSKQRRRVILLMSRNVDKGSEARLQETARQMQFDNVIVYSVDISQFLSTITKRPEDPRPAFGGIPAAATPNARGNVNTDTTTMQNQQLGNMLSAAGPVYRGIRDVFKKTPAEALTQFTGGRIYGFATERALERAVTDIGKELHSQYLLSYSPDSDTRTESGFHTIKVIVNRPQLDIRGRPGYWWGGGKQ